MSGKKCAQRFPIAIFPFLFYILRVPRRYYGLHKSHQRFLACFFKSNFHDRRRSIGRPLGGLPFFQNVPVWLQIQIAAGNIFVKDSKTFAGLCFAGCLSPCPNYLQYGIGQSREYRWWSGGKTFLLGQCLGVLMQSMFLP
jgi:hypothetical protein